MWLAIDEARAAPLVTVAYDVACSRRARRVRRRLMALHHARQYSVFELRVEASMLRRVLAETVECCDFDADRLAVWWPLAGLRLEWGASELMVAACNGGVAATAVTLPAGTANFILCYDITDPRALRAVGAEIAAVSAMLQRSVYWLRAPMAELSALCARCAPWLDVADRLWVYPLRNSQGLQRWGGACTALLPLAHHHWRLV